MKGIIKKIMGIIMVTAMIVSALPALGENIGEREVKAATVQSDESVSETYLNLIGRTYYKDKKLVLTWTNSGFSFNFTGTGATADISTGFYSDGFEGFLNVYVDGALVPTKTLEINRSSGTYVLAENLENTVHTISVRKRSEVMQGEDSNIQFSKIDIQTDILTHQGRNRIERLNS